MHSAPLSPFLLTAPAEPVPVVAKPSGRDTSTQGEPVPADTLPRR
ncbi:MAG: hypothetical protein JWR10_1938 [Rubritepida sp.]|nr:hypothetical protein [Rubritepida sp.]